MDEASTKLAQRIADAVGSRTVACAESFTAGTIAQSLATAEAASEWFAGAVVAYQEQVKRRVLGVQAENVVSEDSAIEMASGVADLFAADVGIATTGVAGPDDQDGVMAGTIVIGWSFEGHRGAQTFRLDGDPEEVVEQGARTALDRLCALLEGAAALA